MCCDVPTKDGIQKEESQYKKGNRKTVATTLTRKENKPRQPKLSMSANRAQNQLLVPTNEFVSEIHSFVILPVAPKLSCIKLIFQQ